MYNYIHQNIVNIISKTEKKFPVHKLVYKNVRIWPLIKVDFNFQLITNNSESISNSLPSKKNWKQKLGDVYAAYQIYKQTKMTFREELLKTTSNYNPLPNTPYIFITFSTFRSNTINDLLFDSQYDTFLSTVNDPNNFCALEFTLVKSTNKKALSQSHNISILSAKADLQMKKSKIWKYLLILLGLRRFFKNKKTQDEFISFLKKEDISCVFNPQYFEDQIEHILHLKNELKKLYKKIKPKYVICPAYFNHESFASTLACNELGIKTIEMQHGVYAQPVYCYYGHIPKEGYELLPNFFLSWDELQANSINDWAKKTLRHKAFRYGLNGLSFWLKNKTLLTNKHLLELNNLLSQKDKIKIIFTISDSIDEKLPKLIQKTQTNCFWFIRNHPRAQNAPFIIEFIKKMKDLNCSNFEIENTTNAPLYPLLWEMDYHLTMISSVVCEAFQINLPSIIINESGKHLFYDFYKDNPLVQFSFDTNVILNTITQKTAYNKKINTSQNQSFESFISNL